MILDDIEKRILKEVADIHGTPAENLIIHGLENRSVFLSRFQHSRRSIPQLLRFRHNELAHRRILRQHAMRLHDGRLLQHFLGLQHLNILLQLLCYCIQCILRLFLFRFRICRFIVHQIAVDVLSCRHDPSDCNTGNDAFALNFL